jgi:YggT family protein
MAVVIFLLVRTITYLVLAHVILSYFMSPYHPIRETVDRLVDPMLSPIRQIIPSAGGLDFSPLVLILLVQFIGNFLAGFL